jgi:hypothetical protein
MYVFLYVLLYACMYVCMYLCIYKSSYTLLHVCMLTLFHAHILSSFLQEWNIWRSLFVYAHIYHKILLSGYRDVFPWYFHWVAGMFSLDHACCARVRCVNEKIEYERQNNFSHLFLGMRKPLIRLCRCCRGLVHMVTETNTLANGRMTCDMDGAGACVCTEKCMNMYSYTRKSLQLLWSSCSICSCRVSLGIPAGFSAGSRDDSQQDPGMILSRIPGWFSAGSRDNSQQDPGMILSRIPGWMTMDIWCCLLLVYIFSSCRQGTCFVAQCDSYFTLAWLALHGIDLYFLSMLFGHAYAYGLLAYVPPQMHGTLLQDGIVRSFSQQSQAKFELVGKQSLSWLASKVWVGWQAKFELVGKQSLSWWASKVWVGGQAKFELAGCMEYGC